MENSTRASKESGSMDTGDLIFSLACLFIYFTAVLAVFLYESNENNEQVNNPNLEILNSEVDAVKVQNDPGFDVFINSYNIIP